MGETTQYLEARPRGKGVRPHEHRELKERKETEGEADEQGEGNESIAARKHKPVIGLLCALATKRLLRRTLHRSIPTVLPTENTQ